jgi:hypothetical protein
VETPPVTTATATGAVDTFTLAASATVAAPITVQIDTIQVGTDSTATASIQKIATDNNGQFFSAPTPDDLTNALLKVITAPPPSPPTPPTLPPTPGLTVLDTTTSLPVAAVAQPYTGPVSGLTEQYVNVTTDSLNITATTPNWFIHSGSGEDAIAVNSGTNVLDGGTGSNFLTGGSGTDTFFVDDRAATADIWSTVVNFHAGDAATIWGVTPSDFNLSWVNGQGAAGYTGLTLHATDAGKPNASLTLAGFSQTDMADGKLTVSFGTTAASGGVAGSTYMYVHAN